MLEPIEKQYVLIGRIVRPYGVDGTVLFDPEIETPELFDDINLLYLQNSRGDLIPARIEQARAEGKNSRLSFFVKFEHITDRNDAESIKRYPVYAVKDKLQHRVEKSRDQWLLFEVFDENNMLIGTVGAVMENPAHLILQVATNSGNLLVPFVDEYIQSTDANNRIIYCKNLGQLEDTIER